jgi:hypothetical protein
VFTAILLVELDISLTEVSEDTADEDLEDAADEDSGKTEDNSSNDSADDTSDAPDSSDIGSVITSLQDANKLDVNSTSDNKINKNFLLMFCSSGFASQLSKYIPQV